MSQEASKGFAVQGKVQFPETVMSVCFTVHKDLPHFVAVLSNNTLVGAAVPLQPAANRREPFTNEECKLFYRKIDRGSQMVSATQAGDIFVNGEDKLMKQYGFPEEVWENIEFKKPPPAPIQELSSHSIGTTCWDYS
jgi:hypothetical protein